uniref:Uncharacterized protein n=1 Tax=Micrurus lemniscatus lemniscatus TaxID=129467 RepID=A0A2D4H7Y6_MICLE
MVKDMLLDQLVCGVRNLKLQRRLLAKGDLTLKIAIEESHADELSMLSAAEIQGKPVIPNSSAIHYEETSPEGSSDEDRGVNRLRQPNPTQKKVRSTPIQPPHSQPICLSWGGRVVT